MSFSGVPKEIFGTDIIHHHSSKLYCLQKLRSKSSPGFQPKGFVALSLTVKSPVSLLGPKALSEEKTLAWCWIWGLKLLVVLLDFHVYKDLMERKREGSKEERARCWQCRRHWAQVKPHGIPSEDTFLLWGWWNSGTGYPERLWNPCWWRCQNLTRYSPEHPALKRWGWMRCPSGETQLQGAEDHSSLIHFVSLKFPTGSRSWLYLADTFTHWKGWCNSASPERNLPVCLLSHVCGNLFALEYTACRLNTCRDHVWMYKYKRREGREKSCWAESFIVSYFLLQWSVKAEGSLFLLGITRSTPSSVKTKAVERTCRGYIRIIDIPEMSNLQHQDYIPLNFLCDPTAEMWYKCKNKVWTTSPHLNALLIIFLSLRKVSCCMYVDTFCFEVPFLYFCYKFYCGFTDDGIKWNLTSLKEKWKLEKQHLLVPPWWVHACHSSLGHCLVQQPHQTVPSPDAPCTTPGLEGCGRQTLWCGGWFGNV